MSRKSQTAVLSTTSTLFSQPKSVKQGRPTGAPIAADAANQNNVATTNAHNVIVPSNMIRPMWENGDLARIFQAGGKVFFCSNTLSEDSMLRILQRIGISLEYRDENNNGIVRITEENIETLGKLNSDLVTLNFCGEDVERNLKDLFKDKDIDVVSMPNDYALYLLSSNPDSFNSADYATQLSLVAKYDDLLLKIDGINTHTVERRQTDYKALNAMESVPAASSQKLS